MGIFQVQCEVVAVVGIKVPFLIGDDKCLATYEDAVAGFNEFGVVGDMRGYGVVLRAGAKVRGVSAILRHFF